MLLVPDENVKLDDINVIVIYVRFGRFVWYHRDILDISWLYSSIYIFAFKVINLKW